MSEIAFHEFIQICGASLKNIDQHLVKGKKFNISIDSRNIKEGDVFWALHGERFDGHAFIKNALDRKAAFCVVQQKKLNKIDFPAVIVPDSLKGLQELARIHRQQFDIPLLALTGSNGKTTTKEMIGHILSTRFSLHKTEGNLNNHIGCPLTLLELRPQHRLAIIELGSNHPGEIGTLTRTALPDHALITNIGGAHLAFFADEQALAREKKDLFTEMQDKGTVFLNLDDPLLADFGDDNKKIIGYSLAHDAQVRGRDLGLDENGCGRLLLNGKAEIQLPVPGRFNIKNALAASAVALHFGFSEAEIRQALQTFRLTDRRMQVLQHKGLILINDAYNANPVSMKAAFETLKMMAVRGRIFLALGDMFELGTQSPALHKTALKQALKLLPRYILVMGEAMRAAQESLNKEEREKIIFFDTHRALAAFLEKQAATGDVLLVKGSRGMQMEKVINCLMRTEPC